MKPEWCPEDVWEKAGEQVLWSDEVFGKVSLTFEESDILHFCIARALLEAHQRGRREGVEEARFAIALERLEEPSDSEGDQAYQTAVDDCERAIRAKMEEQP